VVICRSVSCIYILQASSEARYP